MLSRNWGRPGGEGLNHCSWLVGVGRQKALGPPLLLAADKGEDKRLGWSGRWVWAGCQGGVLPGSAGLHSWAGFALGSPGSFPWKLERALDAQEASFAWDLSFCPSLSVILCLFFLISLFLLLSLSPTHPFSLSF